ncbi:MAG TPA: YIP1 family protein [Anaerolineales bacterium]|nr:YIP1 family protein [Anaerolineales bacterium]
MNNSQNDQPTLPPISFANLNPWWRIWLQPRKTIQSLITTDSRIHFWVLAVFYGIIRAASLSMDIALGDHIPPSDVALFILAAGSFSGIISIFFLSSLLKIVGGLLGGSAESKHIRTVLVWATVPLNVLTVLGLFPLISLFGADIFTTDPKVQQFLFGQGMTANFIGQGLLLWRNLLELIGSLYYLLILIIGYADIQKFNIWKSIGAFVIVFGGMLLMLAACLTLSPLPV